MASSIALRMSGQLNDPWTPTGYTLNDIWVIDLVSGSQTQGQGIRTVGYTGHRKYIYVERQAVSECLLEKVAMSEMLRDTWELAV